VLRILCHLLLLIFCVSSSSSSLDEIIFVCVDLCLCCLCSLFLEIIVADVLVLGRSWKIIASESLGFVEIVNMVKMRLLMSLCQASVCCIEYDFVD
jgi:hypothetical protein